MSARITIAAAALAGLALAGCSTRPREFSARFDTPVADRLALQQTFADCRKLVRAGYRSDFKGAAATGLATGAGTFGAGAAMVGAGVVGPFSTGAAATAASVAMPVVGLVAGFGISRAIRSGRERKYKTAMSACLGEYGYAASGWSTVSKHESAATVSARNAALVKLDPALAAAEVAVPPAAEH